MGKINLSFITKLLEAVINMISPELKEYLKKMILDLEDKAKATANPFDDLLVELLKNIFF